MAWLFSADNHIIEAEDVWVKRMPKSMRHRAPRYFYDGEDLVGTIDGEERQRLHKQSFGLDVFPHQDDVKARIEMLESDGVWGEAVHGNFNVLGVMCLEEPEFALACARAYNDWVTEIFDPYRDRIVAHPYIPMCLDPETAVTEIERNVELGFRSISIPLWPPEPYYLRKFDPIWEAAAAHNLPICMHAHSGRWFRNNIWKDLVYPEVDVASTIEDPRGRAAVITGGGGFSAPQQGYQCNKVSGWFIGSGTLDRHPNLHLIFVECGSAWMLSASQWVDEVWRPRPGVDRENERILDGEWSLPLWPE